MQREPQCTVGNIFADDTGMADSFNARLDSLCFDIAMRLRDVCKGWPDEQFEKLVRSVADITARYDMGADGIMANASIAEKLGADMRALADQNAERRSDLH